MSRIYFLSFVDSTFAIYISAFSYLSRSHLSYKTMTTSLKINSKAVAPVASSVIKEPLKVSGALPPDYFEVTSIIGREYPTMQLSELMNSPRRDEYIRDLAITGTWSSQ